MNNASKAAIVIAIILSMGVGLLAWKVANPEPRQLFNRSYYTDSYFSSVPIEEYEAFLESLPGLVEAGENEMKELETIVKGESESTETLLGIARASLEKFILDDDVTTNLEIIERRTWAELLDGEKSAADPVRPSFGDVTEEQIDAFWKASGAKKESTLDKLSKLASFSGDASENPEAKFERFAKAQFNMAKKAGRIEESAEMTEEIKVALRKQFAILMIVSEEAKSQYEKDPKGRKKFRLRASFMTRMEQAKFLAAIYSSEIKDKLEVTDAQVAEYLKKNPDFGGMAEKKKLIGKILSELAAGADFATLADTYSEDPGSKGKGGLYTGVAKGAFVPEFEKAALALKPGEYTTSPVDSAFGSHIIKLEGIKETKNDKGETELKYDARHILISNKISDPANPFAQPKSVEEAVKSKLADENREKILDDIRKRYPVKIEIPDVIAIQKRKKSEESKKEANKTLPLKQ